MLAQSEESLSFILLILSVSRDSRTHHSPHATLTPNSSSTIVKPAVKPHIHSQGSVISVGEVQLGSDESTPQQ